MLLTKKELRNRLGVCHKTLTKQFTAELLMQLGVSIEQYRRIKYFTAAQSAILVQYFNL